MCGDIIIVIVLQIGLRTMGKAAEHIGMHHQLDRIGQERQGPQDRIERGEQSLGAAQQQACQTDEHKDERKPARRELSGRDEHR